MIDRHPPANRRSAFTCKSPRPMYSEPGRPVLLPPKGLYKEWWQAQGSSRQVCPPPPFFHLVFLCMSVGRGSRSSPSGVGWSGGAEVWTNYVFISKELIYYIKVYFHKIQVSRLSPLSEVLLWQAWGLPPPAPFSSRQLAPSLAVRRGREEPHHPGREVLGVVCSADQVGPTRTLMGEAAWLPCSVDR